MSNKKFTILIVDDNTGFISRMRVILDEVANFTNIHAATSHDEAYDLFNQIKPDLVMLDIRLPDKSGLSLLKEINDSPYKCRVIMNSNYTNDHYRQESMYHGAEYFLDKTNDFEIVPQLIREIAVDTLQRVVQN